MSTGAVGRDASDSGGLRVMMATDLEFVVGGVEQRRWMEKLKLEIVMPSSVVTCKT